MADNNDDNDNDAVTAAVNNYPDYKKDEGAYLREDDSGSEPERRFEDTVSSFASFIHYYIAQKFSLGSCSSILPP
jgi:hypothetical protein